MDDTILIALCAGGIGCLFLLLRKYWTLPKLPPGPIGLPLIGTAYQIDPDHPFLKWATWAKEYGGIYTLWNFGKPTVMVNSFEALTEMYVTKSTDFAGRPTQYVINYATNGGKMLTAGDFDAGWIHRKKMFSMGVKMYGGGQQKLELLMQDILAELVENVHNTNQQAFNPQKTIELALANTLSLLLTGSKFDSNDPDFHELTYYTNLTREVFSQCLSAKLFDLCPWLHYLPLPYSRRINEYVDNFMGGWILRQVQKRKLVYDGDNCECVLDGFLKQQELDIENGVEHPIEDSHIYALCAEFFLAGMNTSTSTLYSLFSVLTDTPEVQSKAQEEIDRVLGERWPGLADRQNMPYIQAMLEELWRYDVISLGIPHKATRDSEICGHSIPKGTEMFPNMWYVFHDPTFWEDPFIFKPERFLDGSGNLLPVDNPKRRRVVVFGAGRRVCPGEQLARNRIFLITTSLLQKFSFKRADKAPVHDPRTCRYTIAVRVNPYQVRAVPRA